MATLDTYKNFAIGQVQIPPSPSTSGTTLTLVAGQGARLPPVPFNATVFYGLTFPTPETSEVVRVTALAGDVVTMVRQQEGSTARAIAANDYVAATLTTKFVADLRDSSNQNAGTLPDARLSTNVQMKPILLSDLPALPPSPYAPHHAAHETGGTDALVALDASILTSGLVADARISSGIARRGQANNFTGGDQVFVGGPAPNVGRLLIRDLSQALNLGAFELASRNGKFGLSAISDDYATSAVQNLACDRNGNVIVYGDLSEKNRSTPIGHWLQQPPILGANTGGITLVTNNTHQYMLVGKTMTFTFYLGVTLGGTPTLITLTIPGAVTAAQYTVNTVHVANLPSIAQTVLGGTAVNLYRDLSTAVAFPTGSISLAGTITIPIL